MIKTCFVGQRVGHNANRRRRTGYVIEIDARRLRARVRWENLGKNLRTWVAYRYLTALDENTPANWPGYTPKS